MKRRYYLLFFGMLFLCCNSKNKTLKNNNVTVTVSEDVQKLEKLADFSIYKPVSVKFSYTFVDNSAKSRLDIPGPSDSFLEALLMFDKDTFKEIKSILKKETKTKHIQKEDFDFEWLPKEVKQELLKSNSNDGYADVFFRSGFYGKLWVLDHKIILKSYTL